MKVKNAMHKGAKWISPDTSLTEVAKMMAKHDIGAVPVGENDRLIGMVTDRDITCRGVTKGGDLSKITARDVMTKGITYCSEENDLEEALRVMQKNKIRRLPVLNEKKRMTGILSLGDISHTGTQELTFEMVKAVSSHH